MKLSGWGRFPVIEASSTAPRTEQQIADAIQKGDAIARGNGRAYGDSAISKSNTIHMRHFNRMLKFDDKKGQLIAESGVLLKDIIETFLPRGWFPAVTPGTKFVTLGGMLAADVHGKNHHKDGSMVNYVDWIELMLASGETKRCSPTRNKQLFRATIGGMGLTGVILRAAVRLAPVETGWIKQKTLVAKNLDQAIDAFETHLDVKYSVAWIDCLAKGKTLGRSLIMLGEHASSSELQKEHADNPFAFTHKRQIRVPFDLPGWTLNKASVSAFNSLYFKAGKQRPAEALVDWESYFYPLDAILEWNRIYGKRGFAQFQCVIPLDQAKAGMTALLTRISDSGCGSFLAVLKRFGKQESLFSFPMEGYTLALDFPADERNLDLISELDDITVEHGGRFYLAKDARLPSSTLKESDNRVTDFVAQRKTLSADTVFCSEQSERLSL